MSGGRQVPSDERQQRAGESGDPPEPPVRFRLSTLGDARLHRVDPESGQEEVLGPGKPLSVVVYLSCSPGCSATRDRLVDLLWANLDLDGARHALRQALWYLRKRMGDEAIRSQGDEVCLSVPFRSDRDRFLEAIQAEDYDEAVDLYRGEFLPLFAAPGGAEFEHWADLERNRLHTYFSRAVEAVVRQRLEEGRFPEAQEAAVRARDLAPRDEAAWRLVLQAYLAAGDRIEAEVQADELADRLREWERTPDPATQRLIELAQDRQAPPGEPAGPATSLDPELVGREREFATLLSAWKKAHAGQSTHVHVEGRAGIGKTRLLSEAFERLEAMGANPVRVSGRQGERDISYALASELAAKLARLPGAEDLSEGAMRTLVSLNPSLSDRYPVSNEARPVTEDARRRRRIALAELVGSVAEAGPLALLVDDVQWADPESRHLLRSLLERMDEERLLVVTAERPREASNLETRQTELLVLDALSVRETETLLAGVASLPPSPWAESFPEELHDAVGGSPLLLLETLRLALERGWLKLEEGAWRCTDPNRMEEALRQGGALHRRILDLPAPRRRLLLLLSAAAGRPLSTELLAESSERDPRSVADDLSNLELRGLAWRRSEGWTVEHDAIAAVVVEETSRVELERAHASLGRGLVRAAGDDPDILHVAGRHLHRADDRGALREVFVRWVRARRARGDRRHPRQLAEQLLGDGADAIGAEDLVAELPLRDRLGLDSGRRVATACAGVAGVVVLLATLLLGEEVPPSARLLVESPTGPEGTTVRELEIHSVGWGDLSEIDLEEDGEMVPAAGGLLHRGSLLPRPGERSWAFTRAVADTGVLDVHLVSEEGETHRLTRAALDDFADDWSPDGRWLLFRTCRWSARCWPDLALHDPATGEVRRLTRLEGPEWHGAWSPEGTRIAFQRRSHQVQAQAGSGAPSGESVRGTELCWTTVDGATLHCRATPAGQSVAGWADPDHLLAVEKRGEARGLIEISLSEGTVRSLDPAATKARVSPGGGWVAALRNAPGAPIGWYVYPTGSPERAVRISSSEANAPDRWRVAWDGTRRGREYLDSLSLVGPDTIPLGVPLKLRTAAAGADGSALSPPILSWRSLDTATATVGQESGRVVGHRPGRARVVVTAGGWRTDTTRIRVRSIHSQLLLQERWIDDLGSPWVPYGDPRPTVVRAADGERAFWNRGDGTFKSGVYTSTGFPAKPGGIGLEASVVSERTKPTEQRIWISLVPWRRSGELSGWDHRTGSVPLPRGRCRFVYPAGDGFENYRRAYTVGSVHLPVPRSVPAGDPYRVQLQLFPDGTCGIALNGEPVRRTWQPGTVPDSVRVLISGKSVDTRILVKSVEVWRGTREDTDWSSLRSPELDTAGGQPEIATGR